MAYEVTGYIEYIKDNAAWGRFNKGLLMDKTFDFPENIPIDDGQIFSPSVGDEVIFIPESGNNIDSYIILKPHLACILHVTDENEIIESMLIKKLSS